MAKGTKKKDCMEPTNGDRFISYKDFTEFVTKLGILSSDVERLTENVSKMLEVLNQMKTEILQQLRVQITELSDGHKSLSKTVDGLERRVLTLETSHNDYVKSKIEFDAEVQSLSRSVKLLKWVVTGVGFTIIGWAVAHSYFLIKLVQSFPK